MSGRRSTAALLLAVTLSACASEDNVVMPQPLAVIPPAPNLTPAASTSALSLEDYLVPWTCPGGFPETVSPGCDGARPQQPQDVMRMRPHDLPGPNATELGYQVGGGWRIGAPGSNRYAAIWSYNPWRERRAPDDGGEIYEATATAARIVATQDGGKPYLQVFQGPECGADGWLLFRTDARQGEWTATIARLNVSRENEPCHPMGEAYTRYRIEDVELTFTNDGVPERWRVRTIIVQHFDHATIEASQAMEEFYFGYHAGRYRWSSYTRSPPVGADLAMRCPALPLSGADGMTLNDCRHLTNYRSDDEQMSGDRYGWPT